MQHADPKPGQPTGASGGQHRPLLATPNATPPQSHATGLHPHATGCHWVITRQPGRSAGHGGRETQYIACRCASTHFQGRHLIIGARECPPRNLGVSVPATHIGLPVVTARRVARARGQVARVVATAGAFARAGIPAGNQRRQPSLHGRAHIHGKARSSARDQAQQHCAADADS